MDEIAEKFNNMKLISALSMDGYPDLLFVAYGKHGPRMICVAIQTEEFDDDCVTHCGLDYGVCSPDTDDVITNEPKKDFESGMSHYCLLLPETTTVSDDEAKRYAVVYHEWDVWNRYSGKGLPLLKENLFS